MDTLTAACQSSGTFPGLPVSIGMVRAWALALLPDGCPRAGDVALVLSELVTNAVMHSASGAPYGRFTVEVSVDEHGVTLTVIDQGPALIPAPRPEGEGGRGLAIVTELADAYEATVTACGRCAWCRITWKAGQ